ncbi:GNAT family N-acetyltransferase [Prauserella oleivorans]|uniref:GNAT family N-acetyltransferase n=1 Tax=Prauserella oleivorans TaxID=1478153 RepID=UPI003628DC92
MSYTIWNAGELDLDAVMRLLHDRVEWLRNRGSDQWSTYSRWRPEMKASIARRETWLMRDGSTNEPVGTITMSTEGDPEFWTTAERQQPALYLAKLATSVQCRGQNLGRLLLDFSLYHAAATGRHEVRMDVWRTATDLHAYYVRQGWRHIRTVELPHRYSGALFSRRVVPPVINTPPAGLEVRPAGGASTPQAGRGTRRRGAIRASVVRQLSAQHTGSKCGTKFELLPTMIAVTTGRLRSVRTWKPSVPVSS